MQSNESLDGTWVHTGLLRHRSQTNHVVMHHAQDDKVVMKERYLGLHGPGEDGVPLDVIAKLATLIDTHLDLDAIVQAR